MLVRCTDDSPDSTDCECARSIDCECNGKMTGQCSVALSLPRMLFNWFDHPLIEGWREARRAELHGEDAPSWDRKSNAGKCL